MRDISTYSEIGKRQKRRTTLERTIENRTTRKRDEYHNKKEESTVNLTTQKKREQKEARIKAKQTTKPRVKAVSQGYNFSVLFIVLLLVSIGIIMVFSSSYYLALTSEKFHNDMFHFFRSQLFAAIVAIAAMVFMMYFNYVYLKRFAWLAYIVSIVLLTVVLFTEAINGSSRWLEVFGFSLQPSEPAKIAIIVFMSTYISKNVHLLKTFPGFCWCFLLLLIPVVIIGAQNLSTAIVVAFIGFCIIFVASQKIWHFVVIIVPASGLVAIAMLLPQFAYRMDRVVSFLDPFADPTGDGFQTVQSLYAIGSGGLFGLGLGQSRQKLGFIPEAYNDIIFSIVCEELGLVGAIGLITLFAILIWRGVKIAVNAHDLFGTLLATGIIAMIAIQVIINIAVVTSSMPVTGMPLPFISYGGSALVFLMISIGVLLNVSKYSR